jgi:GDP-L-fucose synthase
MASASLFVMDLDSQAFARLTQPDLSHINVGSGIDVSIAQLATIIAEVVGFQGKVTFDLARPDGTARKLLDVTRLATEGWRAEIGLREGIEDTYRWYLANQGIIRSTRAGEAVRDHRLSRSSI